MPNSLSVAYSYFCRSILPHKLTKCQFMVNICLNISWSWFNLLICWFNLSIQFYICKYRDCIAFCFFFFFFCSGNTMYQHILLLYSAFSTNIYISNISWTLLHEWFVGINKFNWIELGVYAERVLAWNSHYWIFESLVVDVTGQWPFRVVYRPIASRCQQRLISP